MSSGKYSLINSDYKLTRVDVLVLRLFQLFGMSQNLSIRELYDVSDGTLSKHCIRQAVNRMADRDCVKVTKVIQFNTDQHRVYYQLTDKARWLMKFHIGLQENESVEHKTISIPQAVDEGGQSSSVQERNTSIDGVPPST